MYDNLAETFGKGSDFELEQHEIDQMYDLIQNDQKFESRMEGEMVQGFEDLLLLERNQKDDRIETLLKEMYKFEENEKDAADYLGSMQDGLEAEIGELYKTVMNESDRLTSLDQILRAQEIDAQDALTQPAGTITTVDK